jgi:hypothetical protein
MMARIWSIMYISSGLISPWKCEGQLDSNIFPLNQQRTAKTLWMKIGEIIKTQGVTIRKVEADAGARITPTGP